MSTDNFLFALSSYTENSHLSILIRDSEYEEVKIAKIRMYGLFASRWTCSTQGKNSITNDERKIIINKVNELRARLTTDFLNFMFDKEKFDLLKLRVEGIYNNGILPKLEKTIQETQVGKKEKLLKAFSQLNEIILAIVTNHMIYNKNAYFYPPLQNEPLPAPTCSAVIASRHHFASNHIKGCQDRQRLELATVSDASIGEEGTETLKDTRTQRSGSFTSILIIENKDDFINSIKTFRIFQILALIRQIETCPYYYVKLGYIFAGIDYSLLEAIMYSADEECISKWRSCLDSIPIEDLLPILLAIQEKCIERSNNSGDEIDVINKRFRNYTAPCQLQKRDILEIDELSSQMDVRSKATHNLALLFKGVKKSEKEHVLKELAAQYYHFKLRLSNSEEVYSCTKNAQSIEELIRLNELIKEKHKDDPQTKEIIKLTLESLNKSLITESSYIMVEGCPYGILYRNFILDGDLIASTPAIEILGLWCIYTREDYIKHKLIHEHEAVGLSSGDLNLYIANKLADMGIKEVRDFFKAKVLNADMLSELFSKGYH